MNDEDGITSQALADNEAGAREINVDELEINILMLVKNAAGAQSVTSRILSRRGWPTKIVTDLGQAIQAIANEKPDLILISINHPSPKILKIPAIIASGFQSTCIMFSELLDTKSNSIISNLKAQHKIASGSSGPHLQRGIRKILNQIYNPLAAEKENSKELDSNQEASTRISGSAAENATQSMHFSSEDMEAVESSSYLLSNKKNKRRLRDIDIESKGTTSNIYMAKGPESKQGISAADMLRMLQEDSLSLSEAGGSKNIHNISESSLNATSSVSTIKTPQNNFDLWDKSKKNSSAPKMKEKSRVAQSGTVNTSGPNSEVKECVKNVILNLFAAEPEYFTLGPAGNLAVLSLESTDYRGFLAVGLPEKENYFKVLELIKADLKKRFNSKKVSMEVELVFSLQIDQEVLLEEWINIEADYSLQLEEDERKADAGVFTSDQDLSEKALDINQEMLSVDIALIDPDHHVPFKTYLHFKNSGRYFKYLNEGRKIQNKQKEKLASKNAEIRINKADLPAFKMYCLSLEIKKRLRKFTNSDAA